MMPQPPTHSSTKKFKVKVQNETNMSGSAFWITVGNVSEMLPLTWVAVTCVIALGDLRRKITSGGWTTVPQVRKTLQTYHNISLSYNGYASSLHCTLVMVWYAFVNANYRHNKSLSNICRWRDVVMIISYTLIVHAWAFPSTLLAMPGIEVQDSILMVL